MSGRRRGGARARGGSGTAGRAGARAAGRQAPAAGQQAWARGALGVGARGARPGRGLGAWASLGQCTQCTRPIFDPF